MLCSWVSFLLGVLATKRRRQAAPQNSTSKLNYDKHEIALKNQNGLTVNINVVTFFEMQWKKLATVNGSKNYSPDLMIAVNPLISANEENRKQICTLSSIVVHFFPFSLTKKSSTIAFAH